MSLSSLSATTSDIALANADRGATDQSIGLHQMKMTEPRERIPRHVVVTPVQKKGRLFVGCFVPSLKGFQQKKPPKNGPSLIMASFSSL